MPKCVHCKIETIKASQSNLPSELTWDHIPPSSWYPDNSQSNIQRWTVPCCRKCNNELGLLEDRLRTYVIPAVKKDGAETLGLRDKVFRSLGIGQKDKLKQAEFEKRKNSAIKLYKEFRPVSSITEFYPNFGPFSEHSIEAQRAIEIPTELLTKVFAKIFRGAEYELNNKRIIDKPFELNVFIGNDILKFEGLNINYERIENLGPGFRVQRLAGTQSVLYKAVIWANLIAYGTIDLIDAKIGS